MQTTTEREMNGTADNMATHKETTMNEHDIENLILESLNLHAAAADEDRCADVPDGIEELFGIRRFSDVGMLSNNAGLVLCFDDGSEFQITIVRSN